MGLSTLLQMHGAGSQVVNDMALTITEYLEGDHPDEALWFKRAKYALVLPMSVYLKNTPPPQPDQKALIWSGSFREWFRNRTRLFRPKNTHLWYSWLQGKRCSLKLTPALVEQAYEKHFKTLTKADPMTSAEAAVLIQSTPVFVELLNFVKDEVKKHLIKDAKESGYSFGSEGLMRAASTIYSHSTSASFEVTRTKGGASAHMYKTVFAATQGQDMSELNRMDYRYDLGHAAWHVVQQRTTQAIYECNKYRSSPHPFEFIEESAILREIGLIPPRDNVVLYCPLTFELVPYHRYTDRYYANLGQQMWEHVALWRVSDFVKPLDATIQAVLEPLKIRIISKGPAWDYYSVKSLQKALHHTLRSLPAFELIGRVLKSSDLDRLRSYALPQHKWASVDYSAATDGSSSSLGLAILEYLCGDLPNADRLSALQVMGHHNLYYPKNKDAAAEDRAWRHAGQPRDKESKKGRNDGSVAIGKQTNGQLMGCPLSFPILCLMNFLVYLRGHMSQSLDESLQRVLVNGDDMLFTGTDQDWQDHIANAKAVGLEMSPGKAYLHHTYANANSTSFHCPLGSAKAARQIGYLNTGLMYGKHKVMQDDREKDSEPIESVLNTILDGCFNDNMRSRVFDKITARYKTDLEERLKFRIVEKFGRRFRTRQAHRNLFLAKSAGGLGIRTFGRKFYVTPDQRLLAMVRLEEGSSGGGPRVLEPLDTIADELCPDLAVDFRQVQWSPWTSSRPATDVEETVYVQGAVDYASVRRDWKENQQVYMIGYRCVGTSRSAVRCC